MSDDKILTDKQRKAIAATQERLDDPTGPLVGEELEALGQYLRKGVEDKQRKAKASAATHKRLEDPPPLSEQAKRVQREIKIVAKVKKRFRSYSGSLAGPWGPGGYPSGGQRRIKQQEPYAIHGSTVGRSPLGIAAGETEHVTMFPRPGTTLWPKSMRIVAFEAHPTKPNLVADNCQVVPVILASVEAGAHYLVEQDRVCGGLEMNGLGPALEKALEKNDFAESARVLAGYFTTTEIGFLGASLDKALETQVEGEDRRKISRDACEILAADWPTLNTINPVVLYFRAMTEARIHVFVTINGVAQRPLGY